jgi:hypothetical protein
MKRVQLVWIPRIVRRGELYADIDAAFEENPPVWVDAPADYVPAETKKHDNSKIRLEPQQMTAETRRRLEEDQLRQDAIDIQKRRNRYVRKPSSQEFHPSDDLHQTIYASLEDECVSPRVTFRMLDGSVITLPSPPPPVKKGRMRNDLLGKRAVDIQK